MSDTRRWWSRVPGEVWLGLALLLIYGAGCIYLAIANGVQ